MYYKKILLLANDQSSPKKFHLSQKFLLPLTSYEGRQARGLIANISGLSECSRKILACKEASSLNSLV